MRRSRKCLIFFGLRHFYLTQLWKPNPRVRRTLPAPSTPCGHVNPQLHPKAASGLEPDLDIAIGALELSETEEAASGAGGEPPRDQRPRNIELLDDGAE